MKEIGGYIEFEYYRKKMLYEDAIRLNCGRNSLAYLILAHNIKKIAMPKFMCDSCDGIFNKYKVEVQYYSIGSDFKPNNLMLENDTWLYVVNYYGQLTNEYFIELSAKFKNLIIDNAQAYFQKPIENFNTIYTCRKFFGVTDGAILYTTQTLNQNFEQDVSYDRIGFLFGRFEKGAQEFYNDYVKNNASFSNEPIKFMSKITENFLRSVDYEKIRKIRNKNYNYLHKNLFEYNKLKDLCIPDGAYMYPLLIENGAMIRKKMQEKNIYIPMLWPSVLKKCDSNDIEYYMANNILPLPVDQRYGIKEMKIIINEIIKFIK